MKSVRETRTGVLGQLPPELQAANRHLGHPLPYLTSPSAATTDLSSHLRLPEGLPLISQAVLPLGLLLTSRG
jgi:hypothetical protein